MIILSTEFLIILFLATALLLLGQNDYYSPLSSCFSSRLRLEESVKGARSRKLDLAQITDFAPRFSQGWR